MLSTTQIPLLLPLLLTLTGCTIIRQREYKPFVQVLDGQNVLEISTYPAEFPTRLRKRAVIQRYESHDEMYFQINIRDKRRKIGPNPLVQSITIHLFSYQMGDEPPTVMLTDYPGYFWMQNNPRYAQQDLPPIPYWPQGKVSIEIDFTLNGERYKLKGNMPAREHTLVLPTLIATQSI